MTIVVNDIAASTGGAMTVLRDFYTYVCEHDHENQWIFLLGKKYFEETQNVKIIPLPHIKKSKKNKLIFDLFTGRKYIHALQPDVVLSLQNIITFGLKVPQAVYIHQAIPFQTIKRFSFFRSSERKLAVVQHLIGAVIKHSAKKSDSIIVQTDWIKNAICQMCHLPQNRVLVSTPTVSRALPVDDARFDPTTFFYPTASGIYKNNACVFQASALLDKKNIVHSVTMTLPPEKNRGNVTCTGRLPYEEVQKLYRKSVLVFPSYMESFGYPLAEARNAGTIVLASDTPFSRELLDGYENAYFFDPFRPEELAALMEKTATGEIQKKAAAPISVPCPGWQSVIDLLISLSSK